jgi:PPOX class probable F420-dependent enzyme
MAAILPESAKDLVDRPIVTTLVTVMPDGQPQATPVWYDYDGTYFRVNTAEGRQKARNLERNAKVTICTIDPQNGFHWIEIRGHVVEIVRESEGHSQVREHINSLCQKYTGNPVYTFSPPGEQRMMILIEADKINAR